MLPLYIGLAVFGVGVTMVDLLGLLGHHDTSGHTAGHDAGHDAGGHALDGSDHDADVTGGAQDVASHDVGAHFGDQEAAGHDAGGHGHGDAAHGHDDAASDHGHTAEHGHGDLVHYHGGDRPGTVLGVGDTRARAVGRIVMTLRLAVYFSLGAGLTGLVALATGIASTPSLAWSASGGVLTAAISRLVRRAARRDLDSSFGAADFIMAEAEIVIGVEAGKLGRARVRRFGVDRDLYVRTRHPGAAIPAGTRVRIVDYDDECYYVETL